MCCAGSRNRAGKGTTRRMYRPSESASLLRCCMYDVADRFESCVVAAAAAAVPPPDTGRHNRLANYCAIKEHKNYEDFFMKPETF